MTTSTATATPGGSGGSGSGGSGSGGTQSGAAYTCPSSANNGITSNGDAGSTTYSETGGGGRVARSAASESTIGASSTTYLAVSYQRAQALGITSTLQAREATAGATYLNTLDFSHLNVLMHVVAVPTAKLAATEAALRAQPGVQSVGVTGQPRHAFTVNAPYLTNDPYFSGYGAAPYYETKSVPGQWDMHAIGLDYAFAYSQSGNGSSVAQNSGALGSSSVKLAIIDTGVDQTHPELAGKIVLAKCFITSSNGQSTSNFSTDEMGHGTNVAGIAAAAIGDGLGFVGAGGNVSLMAYRVFPTPDDTCAVGYTGTADAVCNGSTTDIASAINDAVTNGANVISLSIGGGTCNASLGYPGNDNDQAEGAAIENAIAAKVVVVAASGNSGGAGVSAPGCDTGVIAVGATSLDDGVANASGMFYGGTAGNPKEYVTSYTQYGVAGSGELHSSSAWGIVAPGGDSTGDSDLLHWIENIWTTTPFQKSPSDLSFVGNCDNDYPSSAGNHPDCRVLIDGTSQATPHVAGAAALIISATGGTGSMYQSPTQMMSLLCTTTDSVAGNEGCGRLNVYRAMATALGDSNIGTIPATPPY